MPIPRTTNVWLLDAHFAVVVIHLIIKQLLHNIDNTFTAGNGSPKILPDLIPQHKLGLAALSIFKIVDMLFKGTVSVCSSTKNASLFGIKQIVCD